MRSASIWPVAARREFIRVLLDARPNAGRAVTAGNFESQQVTQTEDRP